MRPNEVSSEVIGAAIEVHRALGPGLLESTNEECLAFELKQKGMAIEQQKPLPVFYKEVRLGCGYRADMIVEGELIVEIKSISAFEAIHQAQILSYMKLSGCSVGLLINFNVQMLKDGLRRVVL